jgi:glycosyltransferase involved in cell wall biosynthesis
VLVSPRDQNPYQELLYEGVRKAGVRVRYTGDQTSSQTINTLLAPVQLIWCRIRGFRILHLHWTFQFSLPWARQSQLAMHVMQWWFRFYLFIAARIGYKIVWTAHDLLPHEQVLKDDGWVRDHLIAISDAVVALSTASAMELRSLGAKNVYVIPFGSYLDSYRSTVLKDEARASFGFDIDDVVVIVVGRMERYKGPDLLLLAAQRLPPTSKIKVMIVGLCSDDDYRSELQQLARLVETRTTLYLEWVPDDELGRYLQASDIAAFPFREITNSSSIILAESFGLPVLIPDLPMLSDVPLETAIRYQFETGLKTDSLLEALEQAEQLSPETYQQKSAAASTWAHSNDWASSARQTIEMYQTILETSS